MENIKSTIIQLIRRKNDDAWEAYLKNDMDTANKCSHQALGLIELMEIINKGSDQR